MTPSPWNWRDWPSCPKAEGRIITSSWRSLWWRCGICAQVILKSQALGVLLRRLLNDLCRANLLHRNTQFGRKLFEGLVAREHGYRSKLEDRAQVSLFQQLVEVFHGANNAPDCAWL